MNLANWISNHSDQQNPLKTWMFSQLGINKQLLNFLCKINFSFCKRYKIIINKGWKCHTSFKIL